MHGQSGLCVLLLLYVDDIFIAFPSTAATITEEIKKKLVEKYKVINLGTAKLFLGIEINTENRWGAGLRGGWEAYASVLGRSALGVRTEQPRQWLRKLSLVKLCKLQRG